MAVPGGSPAPAGPPSSVPAPGSVPVPSAGPSFAPSSAPSPSGSPSPGERVGPGLPDAVERAAPEPLGSGAGSSQFPGWSHRSNSVIAVFPSASAVNRPQIRAGTPPPLTRGSPSAPYSDRCAPESGSCPIRATTVASSGVYPANQAARSSSAVPVLPAAGRPADCAAVPVPLVTTLWRIAVVVSAATRSTVCRTARPGSATSLPSLVTRATSVYAPCRPWLARVAYASAMSRTLAVAVPRAMDGDALRSGVFAGMPRSSAVCRTLAGPTSIAICAYTEFTDLSVASVTVIRP